MKLVKFNQFSNSYSDSEYLLEKKIQQLLLESKVIFSEKFVSVLKEMQHPLSELILSLKGLDKDVRQNYIDVDFKNPEEVTFIQDSTANRILEKDKDVFILENTGRILKFEGFGSESSRAGNSKVYEFLGMNISEAKRIPRNEEVKILKEDVSPLDPQKTYCLVESIVSGNKLVINKTGLNPKNLEGYTKIWNQSRNPIGVGRFIRKMIPFLGQKVKDSDIEDFVNEFKSVINIFNDIFLKFDVVQGRDIYKFYRSSNSVMGGTLGNSCMIDASEQYFYIYINNPEKIKMVVLYDGNGEINDGEYKSNKIVGRALLWKTDQGDMFMDRIYYTEDSQKDLFKKYADKNGWWSKKTADSRDDFDVVMGEQIKGNVSYTVKISNWEYKFPYMDSLQYLLDDHGILTNDDSKNYSKVLTNTPGDEDGDDDYNDDDDY
jgi:hypothetical protein